MAASVDLSSVTDSFYPRSDEGDDTLEVSPVFDEVVLYGRIRETNLLLDAYSRMSRNNQPQVTKVIVHGDAGSGKTSLVELLRKPVFDSNGFFASGKYFQNSAVQEPNSAIMAALSDLCDLLIQSPDFTEERRMQFQQKLGVENGRVLEKCISNLSPLLAKEPGEDGGGPDMSVRNVAAYSKFMVAFKTFLLAVSCDKHPIVLFIDDVQWMDKDSRKLIEVLLHDQELSNIMIILTYRDEESASVADIFDKLTGNEDTLDLALRSLDTECVFELISSTIGSSTSLAKELSDIIAKKTMGNPYHVMKLLEFLQWEGLLVQNSNTGSWEFDVDQIQKEVMISVTLAEILAMKVQSLPISVQESLKIASLLGYRFTEDLVVRVRSYLLDQVFDDESDEGMQSSETFSVQTVSMAIEDAMRGCFVEKTKEGYQFSHDTIQTAFQSLIDEEEKGRIHMAIGNVLLDIDDAESRYCACIHLFNSPHFVRDDSNRVDLARLHLESAKYCKERSVFIDAAATLRRGLSLLDDARKWTDFYDLAFEMTETLARMELIVGNHDACTKMTNEVLDRAKTTSMRINALLIGVECVMVQNDVEASIAAATRALCSLGIVVPRKVSFRLIGSKLLKVKWMLGRKSDDDILGLPFMKDEAATAAPRLLVNLCSYCLLKDEANLGIYAALLALQLTLKDGLNAFSACAFAIYGVTQLSSGNYRGAYRFGKLALALQDKTQVRDAECATTVLSLTLLTHWYEPLRGMTETLRRAASIGFEVGDVLYGTYCLAMVYGTESVLGTNLEQLEATMRADAESIGYSSQEAMDMWTQPVKQYVQNLRSNGSLSWLEVTTLTGEFMDEEMYIRRAFASNHQILFMMAMNYKASLACCFGFWSLAESLFIDLTSMGTTYFFSYAAPLNSLFGGIASYSCYQQNGKRKHLKLARKNRRRLASAVSRGCPNSPPYLSFLDAEDLAIRKSAKPDVVTAAYNTAIIKLALAGVPHTEANALERAGFFQAKLGNYDEAACYFEKALHMYYNTWGSIARHDWLVEQGKRALGKIEANQKTGPLIHSIVATCEDGIDV